MDYSSRITQSVGELRQRLSQPTLLVADRAKAHKASLLAETHLVLARLPTACPELSGSGQPSGGAVL